MCDLLDPVPNLSTIKVAMDVLQVDLSKATEVIEELVKRPGAACQQQAAKPFITV